MSTEKPPTKKSESMSAPDSYAMAIGYVCIEWGLLEGTFDRFMRQLLNWTHRDEVTHILNMNIRLSEKITLIRAIGTMYSPSRRWLAKLTKALATVDGEIRPLRNRFVHDMWHVGESEPFSRRTRTTTITRPQSFQIQVTAFSDTATPLVEVLALVSKIRDVSEALNDLATEYGNLRHNPRHA
jgi:hypothetical protein